ISAVKRGFRILKVKVGKEGEKDIERIAAIRDAVGKDVKIRVDANQGWTAKEAIRILSVLEREGLDIELCEQPVKAQDIDGLRAVTKAVSTPILADESVFSAEDAMEILRTHAADLINIKLMKTGGIYGALKICAIAETCGVECMMGCMLESKLAVSAAAHLAAAKRIITRTDLDGPSLCRTDPFEGGPDFLESRIVMNARPGIGIQSVPAFPSR
ncbi:MAG: dipeptide epimerase, partial [Clostridiales bacterium]|nr:dipeptide epimerase [Clostridiales bacterium]